MMSVVLRFLLIGALIVVLLPFAVRLAAPFLILLLVPLIFLLLLGPAGGFLTPIALRLIFLPFRLLLGLAGPRRTRGFEGRQGQGFRVRDGQDLYYVRIRAGAGRIAANDSLTVIGHRSLAGVIHGYYVRNHTDGSSILAPGVVVAFLASGLAFLILLGCVAGGS